MVYKKMTKNEKLLMKNKNREHYIKSILESGKKNTIRNKYIRKCDYKIKNNELVKKYIIKQKNITFNDNDDIFDKVNDEINKLDKKSSSFEINKAILLNVSKKMDFINKAKVNYQDNITTAEKDIIVLKEKQAIINKEIGVFKDQITILLNKEEDKNIKLEITSKKDKIGKKKSETYVLSSSIKNKYNSIEIFKNNILKNKDIAISCITLSELVLNPYY
jgi:hypothetical protein